MMSCEASCLNSGARLSRTAAAAWRNSARRSLRTLVATGVIACIVPARQAMRVDVVTALRAE